MALKLLTIKTTLGKAVINPIMISGITSYTVASSFSNLGSSEIDIIKKPTIEMVSGTQYVVECSSYEEIKKRWEDKL